MIVSWKISPPAKSTSNTKNAKQRTAKVTKEAPGNGRESTTPKYGKPMEEKEIHIEPL